MATIDRSKYSLSAQPSPVTKALRFHLGEPISVKWAAAEGHSRRDWIGMYLITRFGGPEGAEESRLITKISSQGKWLGVAEDEWEGDVHTGATGSGLGSDASATVRDGERTSGVSTFRKNKLPWVTGTYELRYHHDAKHNVLARSGPLEIYGEHFAARPPHSYIKASRC